MERVEKLSLELSNPRLRSVGPQPLGADHVAKLPKSPLVWDMMDDANALRLARTAAHTGSSGAGGDTRNRTDE